MTSKVDICNNALDLVGQGVHIDSLDENSKEADLCKRLYQLTVERSLSRYNFSFARRDEVILPTAQQDVVVMGWKYAYELPEDVQRILFLSSIDAGSEIESIGAENNIRFNFRNHNNKKLLVTDALAPFAIHYQAIIDEPDMFTVDFTEAIEYLLASRIASSLVHGSTGVSISQALLQQGLMFLSLASGADAQQGADSIQQTSMPSFIKARGAR